MQATLTHTHYTITGHAISQTHSHRLYGALSRVRSYVNPYGIYGGQIDAWTGYPPSTPVS